MAKVARFRDRQVPPIGEKFAMAEEKNKVDTSLRPDRFGVLRGTPEVLRSELPFKQGTTPVPQGFHRLSGMKKLNTILDFPQPEAFVQNLPDQELHQLIHHIGLEDAAVLVPHATQDQFKSLLYLDLWVGYDFVPERLERWVWALDEYGQHGDVAARLGELDTELLSNLLSSWTRIYMKETQDEELDLPDTPYLFASPDQRFHIEVLGEKAVDRFPLVHRIVGSLYQYDLEHAHRVLDQARAGVGTEIEESILHFRNAWLEDFGFLPLDIAGKMYRFVGLERVQEEIEALLKGARLGFSVETEPVLCTSLMNLRKSSGFLREVLATLDNAEDQTHFAIGFSFLCNRAAVVHRLDLTDLAAYGLASRRTFHTLSIALEYLTQSNVDRAGEILVHVDLVTLHRVGVSLLERAGQNARKALHALGGVEAQHLFDAPLDEVMAAAAMRFPFYPEILDSSESVSRRPFKTLLEVDRVRALTASGRVAAEFFARSFGLSATPPGDGADLESRLADTRLSTVWLTLLVGADNQSGPGLSPVGAAQARTWLASLDRADLEADLARRSDTLLKAHAMDEADRQSFLSALLTPCVDRVASLPTEIPSDTSSAQLLADAFLLD